VQYSPSKSTGSPLSRPFTLADGRQPAAVRGAEEPLLNRLGPSKHQGAPEPRRHPESGARERGERLSRLVQSALAEKRTARSRQRGAPHIAGTCSRPGSHLR